MDSVKFYSGDRWVKPKVIAPGVVLSKQSSRRKSKIKTHRQDNSKVKFVGNEPPFSRNIYTNDQYKYLIALTY